MKCGRKVPENVPDRNMVHSVFCLICYFVVCKKAEVNKPLSLSAGMVGITSLDCG